MDVNLLSRPDDFMAAFLCVYHLKSIHSSARRKISQNKCAIPWLSTKPINFHSKKPCLSAKTVNCSNSKPVTLWFLDIMIIYTSCFKFEQILWGHLLTDAKTRWQCSWNIPFFIRHSFIRNLYWDSQMAKKLSVLKPQRLQKNFKFFFYFLITTLKIQNSF